MLNDPDRAFALTHVPAGSRAAVEALWALDERLGSIVATTTQPLVGQMRLTWWYEALIRLDGDRIEGEPLLAALSQHGFDGAQLAAMIPGWEALLEIDDDPDAALRTHATERGNWLFDLTANVLGGAMRGGGEAWALADFARRCSDPAIRDTAWQMAARHPVDRSLPRPLRGLARLAVADAKAGRPVRRSLLRLLAAAR